MYFHQCYTLKCVKRSWIVLLYCEKSSINSFVAPEDASYNLINCPQWCLCGYVALWVMLATGFAKQSTHLHCAHITLCGHFEISPFSFTSFFLPFKINMVPSLPTMQFSHWAASPQAMTRLHAASSGTTKGFYICRSLRKTCKHTLMCRIGGVTL